MLKPRIRLVAVALLSTTGLLATTGCKPKAPVAVSCAEPAAAWRTASPEAANVDGAKLQSAIDAATLDSGHAVRVYRNGCLIGKDRGSALNADMRFQSWSMAKSVMALVFARAWTLGQISPADPVGSLVGEADGAHGELTARNLLTQTSGLDLNPARDFNIFMPDRLKAALRTEVIHRPGTTFGYSQSGVALLGETIERAVGEDLQAFAQRELLGPIGIEPGTWTWERDLTGTTQGFFGVHMTPDDYARLGELLRRDGVWNGRRLLSKAAMAEIRTPNRTNGCHSWLIWVNRAEPCTNAGSKRNDRLSPGLPADMIAFNGLFGQYVAVFPTQGVVVVRLGGQSLSELAGGGIDSLYRGVLDSIREPRSAPPAPVHVTGADNPDVTFDPDTIMAAISQPWQVTDPIAGWLLAPLPPAGPPRPRAAIVSASTSSPSAAGRFSVSVSCPQRWAAGARPCAGTALARIGTAQVADPVAYSVAPGRTATVSFTIYTARRRELCTTGSATYRIIATNKLGSIAAPATSDVRLSRPTAC